MLQGTWEGNTLTIHMPDRIDASSAAAVEAKIDEICAQGTVEKMILDAEDLTYTSSAGLRIIVKLAKREKNVVIINVSPEVYDIFHVSGFTNFISIEKKA
jgi:anti-anti-sigma factor